MSRKSFSCFSTGSGPHFMNIRIAVGEVWKIETPFSRAIFQMMSLDGQSGAPSNMIDVVPSESGP